MHSETHFTRGQRHCAALLPFGLVVFIGIVGKVAADRIFRAEDLVGPVVVGKVLQVDLVLTAAEVVDLPVFQKASVELNSTLTLWL